MDIRFLWSGKKDKFGVSNGSPAQIKAKRQILHNKKEDAPNVIK